MRMNIINKVGFLPGHKVTATLMIEFVSNISEKSRQINVYDLPLTKLTESIFMYFERNVYIFYHIKVINAYRIQ